MHMMLHMGETPPVELAAAPRQPLGSLPLRCPHKLRWALHKRPEQEGSDGIAPLQLHGLLTWWTSRACDQSKKAVMVLSIELCSRWALHESKAC